MHCIREIKIHAKNRKEAGERLPSTEVEMQRMQATDNRVRHIAMKM